MPAAMTRQEGDLPARQFAHDIGVRGRTPGRRYCALLMPFKSRHGVESAAADDANSRFHSCISSVNTPPVEAG